MSLAVNIICRNFQEDRVIPRFTRYLRDFLGWDLTARPVPGADVYYLSAYFEQMMLKPWPKGTPVMAYFTHREVEPPGNGKAKMFDAMAGRVDLRIATAAMYTEFLMTYGQTVQINPPVERDRFTIPKQPNTRLVAGFSGYTYQNRRKGEDIARLLVSARNGRSLEWRASGRGWPVQTRQYRWSEMPAFYQSLDILVVTSRVEGVPMPPLECLACGVSVVVPRGVGLLDELPDLPGIHRYQVGSAKDCLHALHDALDKRSIIDRQALRDVTDPYTIGAWCEQHHKAVEEVFEWKEEFI
jgi:glycosyltransferase involved in cell wall biosynthesis